MRRLALLFVLAACTRDRLIALEPPAPALAVSQTHVAFGGVRVGQGATIRVTVSNSGSAPSAPLAPAVAGDAAFAAGGCVAALAPGASCDLTITFTPRAFGSAAATMKIAGALAVAVDGYGRQTVRLTAATSGNGSIDPCGSPGCVVEFEAGQTVPVAQLHATPDAGWALASWSGDCAGAQTDCALTMDRDRAASATFVKLAKVTVEATSLAAGSGDVQLGTASCHAPCSLTADVVAGTPATVVATPDGSSQARWTQGCAGTDARCTVTAGATVRLVFNGANYVFVTSSTHAADEGVAAFDAACNAAAREAGLPGPYLAWISTTTTPAEQRAGAARGFIRLDGLPFIEGALGPYALVDYPVVFDEHGNPPASFIYDRAYFAGRSVFEKGDVSTCKDWTSASESDPLDSGDPLGGALFWDGAAASSLCSWKQHLLCFGAALTRPLARASARGRIAFVTREDRWIASGGGVARFDQACADEARAANLPGTYKALVATANASAASRFDLGGPAWVRPDGVALFERASDLASGTLVAPFDVHADSSFDRDTFAVWTGAARPGAPGTAGTTCSDWTSTGDVPQALGGVTMNIEGRQWFDWGPVSCQVAHRLYCLQE